MYLGSGPTWVVTVNSNEGEGETEIKDDEASNSNENGSFTKEQNMDYDVKEETESDTTFPPDESNDKVHYKSFKTKNVNNSSRPEHARQTEF